MKSFTSLFVPVLSVFAFLSMGCTSSATDDLVGLWHAHKNFGPHVRGDLVVSRLDNVWTADVSGHTVEFTVEDDDRVMFSIPGSQGSFDGRLQGKKLSGHWTQPPPVQVGQRMSSPVHFSYLGKSKWRGSVVPRESEYTLYMPISAEKDGTLSTFIRNPDRNLGIQYNLDSVTVDKESMQFVGAYFYNDNKQTLFDGIYNSDNDYFTALLSSFRGGSYDFHRVEDLGASHFYARGYDPEPYVYRAPPSLDDGWPTSTLEKEGIRLAPLREMIEKEISPVASAVHDLNVHGVLIARNGKLVFEEYFHGFHRNQPHDTRSASKSMASMLVGVASQAKLPIGPETSVYSTLLGEAAAGELEPRKKAMTLEHLLTMSSGFYCDDNDQNAPGNENTMQEQGDEPNWYRYTMNLPMAMAPGKEAIYCSANTNMIGAVLTASTGKSVRDIFARYLAEPLKIKRYYLGLQPSGEVYLGGGAQWLPRDFMKLGQVMLNDGTWNGQRIVSKQWARDSVATQVSIGDRAYGYQWWIEQYPYKDRTVRAFFAGGNGGQLVMGIPELDLLIAFYGGNYSSSASRRSQSVLVPEYILKAID